MSDLIVKLINRYRRSGLLVDTNVLLLYFIGSFDPARISRFKRTADRFVAEDYYTLIRLLSRFDKVVTTPNILTEVSNLCGQLGGVLPDLYFAKFAERISVLDERYVASKELAARKELVRFGLTDAGILRLAKHTLLVLTDDLRLSQYMQKLAVDVVNFNHIRMGMWRLS